MRKRAQDTHEPEAQTGTTNDPDAPAEEKAAEEQPAEEERLVSIVPRTKARGVGAGLACPPGYSYVAIDAADAASLPEAGSVALDPASAWDASRGIFTGQRKVR